MITNRISYLWLRLTQTKNLCERIMRVCVDRCKVKKLKLLDPHSTLKCLQFILFRQLCLVKHLWWCEVIIRVFIWVHSTTPIMSTEAEAANPGPDKVFAEEAYPEADETSAKEADNWHELQQSLRDFGRTGQHIQEKAVEPANSGTEPDSGIVGKFVEPADTGTNPQAGQWDWSTQEHRKRLQSWWSLQKNQEHEWSPQSYTGTEPRTQRVSGCKTRTLQGQVNRLEQRQSQLNINHTRCETDILFLCISFYLKLQVS